MRFLSNLFSGKYIRILILLVTLGAFISSVLNKEYVLATWVANTFFWQILFFILDKNRDMDTF